MIPGGRHFSVTFNRPLEKSLFISSWKKRMQRRSEQFTSLFIYLFIYFILVSLCYLFIAQLKHHEHEPSGILLTGVKLQILLVTQLLSTSLNKKVLRNGKSRPSLTQEQRKNNTTDLTYALHSLSYHSFTTLANDEIELTSSSI